MEISAQAGAQSRRGSVTSRTAAAIRSPDAAHRPGRLRTPALIGLVTLAAIGVVLVWGREYRFLRGVSGAFDTTRSGHHNSTGDGWDAESWDIGTLLRKWISGREDEDAEEDAGEVALSAVVSDEGPIGANAVGLPEGSDPSPSPALRQSPRASQRASSASTTRASGGGGGADLPPYAQLPYVGPTSLGGTPDPEEEDWLLPAPPEIDLQIRRDLSPWKRGGLTMADLRAQKSGKGPLKLANDSVWDQPLGLFSVVIWRNVPYLFVNEVRFILKSFLFGAVLKILDFMRLMFSVAKHTRECVVQSARQADVGGLPHARLPPSVTMSQRESHPVSSTVATRFYRLPGGRSQRPPSYARIGTPLPRTPLRLQACPTRSSSGTRTPGRC